MSCGPEVFHTANDEIIQGLKASNDSTDKSLLSGRYEVQSIPNSQTNIEAFGDLQNKISVRFSSVSILVFKFGSYQAIPQGMEDHS